MSNVKDKGKYQVEYVEEKQAQASWDTRGTKPHSVDIVHCKKGNISEQGMNRMEEDQEKQIDTERETLLIKTNERKYITSKRGFRM